VQTGIQIPSLTLPLWMGEGRVGVKARSILAQIVALGKNNNRVY